MKKKYISAEIFEYFLIIFFFVLPSLIEKTQTDTIVRTVPGIFTVLSYTVASMYFLIRLYDAGIIRRTDLHMKITTPVKITLQGFAIFFLLIFTNAVSNYIMQFYIPMSSVSIFMLPENFPGQIWLILSTTVFACFEEILFRRFLPDKARYIIAHLRKNHDGTDYPKARYGLLIVEFVCIVLFAFAHRYMGATAVITAFCSAIILRISVVRCKTILPACIGHTLNNLLAIFIGI